MEHNLQNYQPLTRCRQRGGGVCFVLSGIRGCLKIRNTNVRVYLLYRYLSKILYVLSMFLWSLSWRFTDLLLFLKGPLVFCILYPFFSTYAAQAGHCPRPLWGDWLGNRHQWPACVCVSICSNNVSSLSDTKLIVASGQMFENSWFSAPYKKSGLRMFVSWSIWLMSPDLTEQLLTASRNVCSTDHHRSNLASSRLAPHSKLLPCMQLSGLQQGVSCMQHMQPEK